MAKSSDAAMDRDAVLRVASRHVASVRLHDPDYRLEFDLCGIIDDEWLFAYRVHCLKAIPADEQESFAGAAGFLVSAQGKVRELPVPLFVQVQSQLGMP